MQGLSLVAASGGHSSSRCAGLSLSRPLLLRSTGSRRAGSVVVAHGPSCSAACGIFPDQGSNPCPLHWQADSQPLRHRGSPAGSFLITNSISLLVTSLFRLSISFWFSLRRLCGSRIFYPLLGCPVCCCITVLMIFRTSVISVVISPLSFLILFESSLFFLTSLDKGLSILFVFKKKPQLLFSLIIMLFFGLFYSFLLWSLLFLFSVDFGLCLFFNSFGQ